MSRAEYKLGDETVAFVDNFEGTFYVFIPEKYSQQWNGVLPQWFIMNNELWAHKQAAAVLMHWEDYGQVHS